MSDEFFQNLKNHFYDRWVIGLVSSHFDLQTLGQCGEMLGDIFGENVILSQRLLSEPRDSIKNDDFPQHSQTSPVTSFQWIINVPIPASESGRPYTERMAATHPAIVKKIRQKYADFAQNNPLIPPIDINIMPLSTYVRPHKLALFDMDSTLIEQEVIVELAKKANIGEQVNAITESAMRGEIDFSESFTRRVALLAGLDSKVLEDIIAHHITFSLGAKRLIAALKTAGYHVVLVSGGFTYFAQYVQRELGIDEIYANELDIVDGKVTGKITSPIVDGQRKAEILQEVAKRLNIDMSETVAVGDGANDLPMLGLADIGIAYRAKPIVQAQAEYAINVQGLDGVMTILGLNGDN